MNEEKEGLFNLGRPLDPKYPSNLLIIIISMASFIGFGLFF